MSSSPLRRRACAKPEFPLPLYRLRRHQRCGQPGFSLRALRRPAGNHLSILEAGQAGCRRTESQSGAIEVSQTPSITVASGASANLLPPSRAARRDHAARRQYTDLRIAAVRAHHWDAAPVRQASGDESDRIIQRHRDDGGGHFCAASRISLGRLRLDRQHVCVHGRLCSPRRHAQPGAGSGRKDFLEQALAGARLWRRHLPAAD